MVQYERLEQLISANRGIVQTAEAVAAGISKPVFYKFVKDRDFERVSHGVYAAPDAWIDTMYLIGLRSRQAVFSHETALFLHDLADREPTQYSVTVKTGYNPSKLKADGIKVYTVKRELYEIGMSEAQTPFGHSVRVYNPERTACDIIRCRSGIEIQTFQDALKQYAKRTDKNLRLLMQYAQAFQVEKILDRYLEVLL
ncbi:MAG: type IV toxin-antitoxin system AbiEi family antitoxin domain-containing protein [Clostridia bacterium]|nr:type IV toxin-antitoxin system AbiEi family antitoxin domain-containing protein [Clostridia bacterium]